MQTARGHRHGRTRRRPSAPGARLAPAPAALPRDRRRPAVPSQPARAAPQRRRGRNFPRRTRFSRERTPLGAPQRAHQSETRPRLPGGHIPPMRGEVLAPRPAPGAPPPRRGPQAWRLSRRYRGCPGAAVATRLQVDPSPAVGRAAHRTQRDPLPTAEAPEPSPARDVAAAFPVVDSSSSEAEHRSQSES